MPGSAPVPLSESSSPPWPWEVLLPRSAAEAPVCPDWASALTDSFGRHHSYLRISLTERCNFRCQYCMPSEGVSLTSHEDLLNTQELLRLAGLFVKGGVTKIRLTGGEPFLRPDFNSLVSGLSQLPNLASFGVSTNGLLLGRHIERILEEWKMTSVNISLDTLNAEKFAKITRRPVAAFHRVVNNIKDLLEASTIRSSGSRSTSSIASSNSFDSSTHRLRCLVKVNVVLMEGVNSDEIIDFVELTRYHPLLIRFIEYMPFSRNQWDRHLLIGKRKIEHTMKSWYKDRNEELEYFQDDDDEDDGSFNASSSCSSSFDRSSTVARYWRVPGSLGGVGVISTMTDDFCDSCNRLRLTADGNLKNCLFQHHETSLRDILRSKRTKSHPTQSTNEGDEHDDEEAKDQEKILRQTIACNVQAKKERHGGISDLLDPSSSQIGGREMVLIGG